MSTKPYRILSLDGGGSWALIQAKALGAIYGPDTDGWAILDHFDLAAANSGGAIVLTLLLKGLSPNEILALFRSQRDRDLVFDRNKSVDRALGGLFGLGPRYHAPGKLAGLLNILDRRDRRWNGEFATRTLDRIAATINTDRQRQGLGPFHFLVMAFDFDAERSVFFRSDPDSPAALFRPAPVPTIAGALHAATNAPLQYYNRPAQVDFMDGSAINYWDGAVGGYNNPVLAAVVEALAAGRARRESIAVLSLGTGGTRLPVVPVDWPLRASYVLRRRRHRGPDGMRLLRDLRKATAAVMADRPEGSNYLAHVMIGDRVPVEGDEALRETRIVRLNPMIQPRYAGIGADGYARWEPHDWFATGANAKGRTLFDRLLALDMDATADAEVLDIERLADLWLAGQVPNQPILADERLTPRIGHASFAEAAARWQALDAESLATPVPEAVRRPRADLLRRFHSWLGRWRRAARAGGAGAAPDVAGVASPALRADGFIGRRPTTAD